MEFLGGRVRFDRNELAGSFGDIGTTLPLVMGMAAAGSVDPASVFAVFGVGQVLTGLAYGLPMPLQPLKAMAVIVISRGLGPGVLGGAGLAIGFLMLALAASGLLRRLASLIPHPVVRGIQAGLGLNLARLALFKYVPSMGGPGFALAAAALLLGAALYGNRRWPAALFIIGLGAAYAAVFKVDAERVLAGVGWTLPSLQVPSWDDIAAGFVVLALPQLPLSLSNSIIATEKTLSDLFPDRKISVDRIGLTYGLLNIVSPFFGGIPVCHGCGGLAGHYTFGARTGGSVLIYGSMYLAVGLFFSGVFKELMQVFPMPILGSVLLFEALALLLLARDSARGRPAAVMVLTALCAVSLPQGYLVGMLAGTVLHRLVTPSPSPDC
ncbi:MAG: transporter [Elusimicrobia bacterium]|nr:transporter [Elusimicrobiota bacterium]